MRCVFNARWKNGNQKKKHPSAQNLARSASLALQVELALQPLQPPHSTSSSYKLSNIGTQFVRSLMAAFSLTTFNLECCKFMPPRQALQSQPQNGRNLDLDGFGMSRISSP